MAYLSADNGTSVRNANAHVLPTLVSNVNAKENAKVDVNGKVDVQLRETLVPWPSGLVNE